MILSFDPTTVLLLGGILFFGQFIYAAIGFGAALFSVTLMSLVFGEVAFFVPLFLLLCLPLEVTVTWKDRKHVQFGRSWRILLVSLPFMILGAFFLARASDSWLQIGMGVLVIATSIYYLIDNRVFPILNRWWVECLVGATSGVLGSMYGMSGPPMVLYFKSLNLGKREFRVGLTSLFLAMGMMRGLIYLTMGLITRTVGLWFIVLLPFVLAGLFVGNIAHTKLSENLFKRLTSVVLMFSGALLILQNLN